MNLTKSSPTKVFRRGFMYSCAACGACKAHHGIDVDNDLKQKVYRWKTLRTSGKLSKF